MNSGVPQGSVLGLLLFTLCVYYLPKVINKHHVYADDFHCYFSCNVYNYYTNTPYIK